MKYRILLGLGLIWGVVAQPLAGQQLIVLNVGYGTVGYDSNDLDRFASSFNAFFAESLRTPMASFEAGRGWYFDGGYEYIYGNTLGMALLTGYHTFSETHAAVFNDGRAREIELKLRDISETLELTWYTRRGALGPLFEGYARRVTLSSAQKGETAGATGEAAARLDGHYTGYFYGVNVGFSVSYGVFPIYLTLRVTFPWFSLGSDVLFDGDDAKLGTNSNYFPQDYAAFANDAPRPRQNAVSEAFVGRQIWLSLAFHLPI